MTITLTIPDDQISLVIALLTRHGIDVLIPGQLDPELIAGLDAAELQMDERPDLSVDGSDFEKRWKQSLEKNQPLGK